MDRPKGSVSGSDEVEGVEGQRGEGAFSIDNGPNPKLVVVAAARRWMADGTATVVLLKVFVLEAILILFSPHFSSGLNNIRSPFPSLAR